MTLYILIQYWDFVYIANKYYFFFKNYVCVRCLSSLCPYKGMLLLSIFYGRLGSFCDHGEHLLGRVQVWCLVSCTA